jgi:holo-[acyl-carrier protein] synthase
VIIGVGIDLVEISRMKKTIGSASGERFVARVLTSLERELADLRPGRRAEFVAGRFAAKEAVVKALGCGIGAQVGFLDIEVRPDERGKPECLLSSAALVRLDLADPEKPLRIHLSITHTNTMAAAYALIEL